MKSRRITKEAIEYYDTCSKCGKEIKGSSEAMVNGNIKTHQISKECKKK